MKFNNIRILEDRIEFVYSGKPTDLKNRIRYGFSLSSQVTHSKYDDHALVFVPSDEASFIKCLKNTTINIETLEPTIYDVCKGPLLAMDPKTHHIPYDISPANFIDLIKEAGKLYNVDKKTEFYNSSIDVITDTAIKMLEKLPASKRNYGNCVKEEYEVSEK